MSRPPPYSKFPEQDENGVDLSLIRSNMRLSPTERIRKADAWARSLERSRAQLSERSRRIFERLKAEW
jgi:hypothetical protein